MTKTPPAAPRRGLGSPLRGLATLAKLLLFGQFRLRRRGRGLQGVHVVFGETVLAPDSPAPAAAVADAAPGAPVLNAVERQVHHDLVAALQRQGERREVFRHLTFLEEQIGRAGLGGLAELPLDVLRRTFDQLSIVADGDDAKGLAELRSRLSRQLVQRGHRDHLLTDDSGSPSDFLQHAQPVVAEAGISEFLVVAGEAAAEATAEAR